MQFFSFICVFLTAVSSVTSLNVAPSKTVRASLHSTVSTGQHQLDGDKRRRVLCHTFFQASALVFLLPNIAAHASNLPQSTGADTSKVGTVETLAKVVSLRNSLLELRSALSKSGKISTTATLSVPKDEDAFKRVFDSYSDQVSYKQKFLDQNAFLMYYTKGFDGPGRPNIEAEINERQTQQFGLRNEAWIAWDNFLTELNFIDDDDNDCAMYLNATVRAVDSYLSLAPASDLQEAKTKVGISW